MKMVFALCMIAGLGLAESNWVKQASQKYVDDSVRVATSNIDTRVTVISNLTVQADGKAAQAMQDAQQALNGLNGKASYQSVTDTVSDAIAAIPESSFRLLIATNTIMSVDTNGVVDLWRIIPVSGQWKLTCEDMKDYNQTVLLASGSYFLPTCPRTPSGMHTLTNSGDIGVNCDNQMDMFGSFKFVFFGDPTWEAAVEAGVIPLSVYNSGYSGTATFTWDDPHAFQTNFLRRLASSSNVWEQIQTYMTDWVQTESARLWVNGLVVGIVTDATQLNFVVGESVSTGAVCQVRSDGKMWKAQATNEVTAKGLLGIAKTAGNANTSCTFLLGGKMNDTGLTTGSEYYLAVSTAGVKTATRPSISSNIVRIVGYAISTTNFYFQPDNTYVEIK